jgi:hypothetical protein
MLLGTYCVTSQFAPSDTNVALSPVLANRMDVVAAPPVRGTTFEDAETTV